MSDLSHYWSVNVSGRCYTSKYRKLRKVLKLERWFKMNYTINTLPVEYANKTVCCFCSQYANENFCVKCNEYKGLMTLAEFMTYFEISEWVADEVYA
jgi:hypothetical protein